MIEDFAKDIASQTIDLATGTRDVHTSRKLVAAHDFLSFGHLADAYQALAEASASANPEMASRIDAIAQELRLHLDHEGR